MSKKKLISVLFAFLFLTFSFGFSQALVDTADDFYLYAQGWYAKGLLSQPLPQVRPYSANAAKQILNQVIESGNEFEARQAQREYDRLFSSQFHAAIEATGHYKRSQTLKDHSKETSSLKTVGGEISIYGDIELHPLASLSYDPGVFGLTKSESNFLPKYTNSLHDSVTDKSELGPIDAYLDMNMNLSVGTANLYGSGGVSRIGFGPFLGQGLALNDTAFHSANFIFNVQKGRWAFSTVYEAIGATDSYSSNLDNLKSGKFLAFHSVKFVPSPKFSISYYENVVWGPKSNFAYLFPAPYMVIQGIGGADSNSQLGFLLEFFPVAGLELAGDFFFDDFDVDALAKGDVDSKNRIGIQVGAIFTPIASVCTRLSLDYTAIMSYVYSHWEYADDNDTIKGSELNYQNYTNNGICIGSSLDPNSDRVLFTANFAPAERLKLSFMASFARHQNVLENLDDDEAAAYLAANAGVYNTSGSLLTHSVYSGGDHVEQAWKHLNFMTADHTMITTSLGLGAEYSLPKTEIGQLSFKAGYTFEYIKNKGVDNPMYPGGVYKITSATTEAEKSAFVKAAHRAWVDRLYDCVNQYISFSVKYSY